MTLAALIRAMGAAGAPAEAIAIAVEAIEAAQAQLVTPDGRSAGAIRQERYRRNKASQSVTDVTQGITGDVTAVTPPFPLVPPKNNQTPPLIPQPTLSTPPAADALALSADAQAQPAADDGGQAAADAGDGDGGAADGQAAAGGDGEASAGTKPQPRRGRGKGGYHPLPLGWVPCRDLSPSLVEAKANWPPGWMAGELEAFRNWALNAADTAGRGLKKDWDSAWQNWLRDRWNDYRKRHGGGTPNGVGSDRNGSSTGYRNALARAAAEDAALGIV